MDSAIRRDTHDPENDQAMRREPLQIYWFSAVTLAQNIRAAAHTVVQSAAGEWSIRARAESFYRR
jgi:hypothetical protein